LTQKPQFEKCSHVSQRPAFRLSAGVSGAFLKRGGLVGCAGLASIVTVLASLGRKEVSDTDAVVIYFAIHEHPFVFRFFLAHELQGYLPAY
jgi:hypothetical protein